MLVTFLKLLTDSVSGFVGRWGVGSSNIYPVGSTENFVVGVGSGGVLGKNRLYRPQD